MPIYFYQTNQQLPLSLESIGNDWAQDDVARPDGYPLLPLAANRARGRPNHIWSGIVYLTSE